METLISGLSSAFATFFSFKAYVILPVFMLILALAAPGCHNLVIFPDTFAHPDDPAAQHWNVDGPCDEDPVHRATSAAWMAKT